MSKRFLVRPEAIRGSQALVEGAEAHHLLHVMRLKEGEPVTLFDGRGTSYQGVIQRTAPKEVWISIQSTSRDPLPRLNILLLCALPRHGKMDTIVEKLTELGVGAIGAVMTQRSVPRWEVSQKEERLARWRRISREACKQSGGNSFPDLLGIFSFQDAVALRNSEAAGILLSPRAEGSLIGALPQAPTGDLFILVGPEGGWSEEEEILARKSGWHFAALWDRTLKVDTACIAAVSIIQSVAKSGVPGATRTPDF